MSRLSIMLTCVALLAWTAYGQEKDVDSKDPPLKTTRAQASYGIGLSIGQQLKRDGLEIDVEALAQGFRDIFADAEPKLSDEQIGVAIRAFQQEMKVKLAAKRKALADKNKKEGATFLAENKKKDGVVTLESGLQYKVLKKGNGPKPKVTDTVTAHYHGTLLDGTVFDSSVDAGKPLTISVGGVIRGWREALQLMSVGDKLRLFVPSDLAYGPDGAGDDIGPHAVLIFEVELLEIN